MFVTVALQTISHTRNAGVYDISSYEIPLSKLQLVISLRHQIQRHENFRTTAMLLLYGTEIKK